MNIQCRICKKVFDIVVTKEQLALWNSGMLIQQAMPELSASDRELLLSQICNDCWKELWKEENKK